MAADIYFFKFFGKRDNWEISGTAVLKTTVSSEFICIRLFLDHWRTRIPVGRFPNMSSVSKKKHEKMEMFVLTTIFLLRLAALINF